MVVTQEEIDKKFEDFLSGKKHLLQSGASNAKLAKNTFSTWILNLSPADQNNAGKNVCANATKGCKEGCLFKAGIGRMPTVIKSRQLTTEVFLSRTPEFMQLLDAELSVLERQAKYYDVTYAVRLNGTSDLPWQELFKKHLDLDLTTAYPHLQAYDYTKSYRIWEKAKGTNYHITFSRSEVNWLQCQWVLGQGGSVSVVFNEDIPETYQGYPVFDGDQDDQRWLDPGAHIIALKYKRVAGVDPLTNPFVVNNAQTYLETT